MNNPILQVQNVSKVYENGTERLTVLQDISLEIPAGEIIAVTGASGCGKSTLINLLAGLDRPTGGSITVAGFDVVSSPEESLTEYRSSIIGLVFQFHYLLKDFSALENVMLPALMAGEPKSKALEAARDLLERVGLSGRVNHYPTQLSGGERQRVAVARALVNDPEVILADEPTGNLDESNSDMVAELLFSLVRHRGKILILVTHDLELGRRGDRIFCIEEGRIRLV